MKPTIARELGCWWLTRLTAAASLLASLLGSSVARADEVARPSSSVNAVRHLLSATLRGGTASLGGDDDGHYPQSGPYAGVGVGYSYCLHHVDLGLELDYVVAPADYASRRTFLPTALVRLHRPFGEHLDGGIDLRAGWSWTVIRLTYGPSGPLDHTFSGASLGLGFDLRAWLTPRLALELGPELMLFGGHDSSDARDDYFMADAVLFGLGGVVRASVGL